jgi:hypothetical protein
MGALNTKVEVVVHINEKLGEEGQQNFKLAIENQEGVFSAKFNPRRHHLVLVEYDRTRLTSRDVLHRVLGQNVCAQLVGPI